MDNDQKTTEAPSQDASNSFIPNSTEANEQTNLAPTLESNAEMVTNVEAVTEAPTIPEQNIIPETPAISPKQKKGGKIGAIILVLLVLILAAGAVYYFAFFKKSGVKTFTGIINEIYAPFDNIFEEYIEKDIANNSVYFEMDGTLTTDIADLKKLSGYSFNFNAGLDARNDELVAGAKINGENKELLNVIFNYFDDTFYASLGKLYTSTLLIDDEDANVDIDFKSVKEELSVEKIKDMQFITNSVVDILNNSFKEDMFKVNLEKEKIGSTSTYAKKVYLEIDENTLSDIVSSLVDGINSNDELVSKIVSFMRNIDDEYTSKDLKEDLDDYKKDILDSYEDPMEITIYTNLLGTEIIKVKISTEDGEMTYENYKGHLYININDELIAEGEEKNNVTNVTVTADDEEIASLKVRAFEKDEMDLDYTIYYSDYDYRKDDYVTKEITGSLKMINKKDKAELKIAFNYDDYEFNYETSVDINKDTEEGTYKLSLAYDGESILLNGKMKLTYGKDLEKLNTTGAKKLSTLTDDELKSILTNFKNQISGTALYDILDSYIDDIEDDFDEGDTITPNSTYKSY